MRSKLDLPEKQYMGGRYLYLTDANIVYLFLGTVGPEDEIPIVGPLRFHDLALVIASASTLVAVALSFFLIFMHATHYTKPNEQRHIIRILFMVPVYSLTSLLSLKYYWHAIYFTIISECYEAFAISAFFALMCHYIAPDLHEQKKFFRALTPIKPWVWPLDWFRACCCGQRGPWRTPANGLTWFNIIWIGIYHYIVIRVACTITAVVTHYFHKVSAGPWNYPYASSEVMKPND